MSHFSALLRQGFVMELLRDLGADVAYSDSNLPDFPEMREHDFDLSSMPLTAENIRAQDAVLLLTDHSDMDYDFIAREARLVIDTRGKLDFSLPNVVRA